MRRICRLPFGARLLRFTPALSSSPGHAPTHETRFFAEAKVAALAPTSAMICCAESTPKPGTSASRWTAADNDAINEFTKVALETKDRATGQKFGLDYAEAF